MAELDAVEAQLHTLADAGPARAEVQHALHELDEVRGRDADEGMDGGAEHPGLAEANTGLGVALRVIENGDRPAPQQALTIYDQMNGAAETGLERWARYKREELPRVNSALARAHAKPIEVSAIEEQVIYAMTR